MMMVWVIPVGCSDVILRLPARELGTGDVSYMSYTLKFVSTHVRERSRRRIRTFALHRIALHLQLLIAVGQYFNQW